MITAVAKLENLSTFGDQYVPTVPVIKPFDKLVAQLPTASDEHERDILAVLSILSQDPYVRAFVADVISVDGTTNEARFAPELDHKRQNANLLGSAFCIAVYDLLFERGAVVLAADIDRISQVSSNFSSGLLLNHFYEAFRVEVRIAWSHTSYGSHYLEHGTNLARAIGTVSLTSSTRADLQLKQPVDQQFFNLEKLMGGLKSVTLSAFLSHVMVNRCYEHENSLPCIDKLTRLPYRYTLSFVGQQKTKLVLTEKDYKVHIGPTMDHHFVGTYRLVAMVKGGKAYVYDETNKQWFGEAGWVMRTFVRGHAEEYRKPVTDGSIETVVLQRVA